MRGLLLAPLAFASCKNVTDYAVCVTIRIKFFNKEPEARLNSNFTERLLVRASADNEGLLEPSLVAFYYTAAKLSHHFLPIASETGDIFRKEEYAADCYNAGGRGRGRAGRRI